MLPPEPIPIFAAKRRGLQLVRGFLRLVEWDTCRKRLVTIILDNPQLPKDSICFAGPATKQHDGVHRYPVEEHCHSRQQAKEVEATTLWVEAQALKINARDEASEHLQGGHGVKVAGLSVVALELLDRTAFGEWLPAGEYT